MEQKAGINVILPKGAFSSSGALSGAVILQAEGPLRGISQLHVWPHILKTELFLYAGKTAVSVLWLLKPLNNQKDWD